MICKDDDVCYDCFRRRKRKDCGYEPFGLGPDIDGEYAVGCTGRVNESAVSDDAFMDCLADYNGIGDPKKWPEVYPVLIQTGMLWLENGDD